MITEEIKAYVQQQILQNNHANQFTAAKTAFHKHTGVGVDGPQLSQSSILPSVRASGSITFAQSTNYTLGITFNPTSVWFYGIAIRRNFVFTVTAANATVGATYTNNGFTFTVLSTITGTTTLTTVGTGSPAASGTLTKASGTGDATITFASSTNPIAVRAHVIGNAQLGPSFYFQPNTTTSVVPSKTVGNMIQSSTMFLIDSTDPANLVVRAIADEGNIVDVEYSVDYGTSISGIVARATIKSFSTNSILIQTVLATGWQIIGNYVVI